jgi:hypothetical protein
MAMLSVSVKEDATAKGGGIDAGLSGREERDVIMALR